MASGGSNTTTFNAKRIIGDVASKDWAGALLHSGTGGKPSSGDTSHTWIFADDYGTVSAPWGIKHDQIDNRIMIIGGGTTGAYIAMGSGNTYLLGKVGIGYDPETSGNSYKLYVNGTSYFTNSIYIGSSTNRFTIHPNGLCYKGTNYDFCVLRVIDGGSGWGHRLVIGSAGGPAESGNGGQQVVIGAGESAGNYVDLSADNPENLMLLADNQIYVESASDTIANRIGFYVSTSGHVLPCKAEAANSNVQDIGSSANKWANIYATTFHGTLDGKFGESSGYYLRYINTNDMTTWTADALGATTSIAFTRGNVTGAYTTGHIVWLNANDIGTPFQLVVHDSSELYFWKRWKNTTNNTWGAWTKMNAGRADGATISTTANALAYYTNTTGTFGNTAYMRYINHNAVTHQGKTQYESGLFIFEPCVGNNDGDGNRTATGTGVLSYGDGGPKIRFNAYETGSQAGELIFTDNDACATGASWSFVSNQSDWNVISKRFHARTNISIGYDLPQSSYNLQVNGTGYFGNSITMAAGTRIGQASGNLAIGNSGNAGWVQVQDMCSQTSTDNWKITQAGTGTFKSLVVTTGNLTFNTNGGAIYYAGSKSTQRMVHFVDNTAGTDGNGMIIGGAGYMGIGSGESAEQTYSGAGYTAGSEVLALSSDGDIRLLPNQQNGYNVVSETLITTSGLWVGVAGNTTREMDIGVRSGAGSMYMWAAASTTGDRGIWLPAHGSGGAKSVFVVDTNNAVTFYGSLSGNASSATYASSYLANRGSISGSTHAAALQAWFNSNKSTEPRNALVAHYSSAHSNGSLCMGYFLSGYDSNPYGGFFVCHYDNPRYVGISNGTYTQHDLVTCDQAQTFTGNKSWGTSGAGGYLNGTATNGGINSIRIGDDIWLGDCNVSGIMGMKSTATNCGFYFYNSSGTNTGVLYNNGTVLYTNTSVYANNSSTSKASFYWNKSGTYWGGIGYGGSSNVNRFGPCDTNGGWQAESTTTDIWRFIGKIEIQQGTEGSKAYSSQNPKLTFRNSDGSQNVAFVMTDYDSVRAPAGIAVIGNQGNEWFEAPRIFNAVWNDLAEYRKSSVYEPGYVITPSGIHTTKRLEPGARIISDTYGMCMGSTDDNTKVPVGLAGLVLAYPARPREEYHIGDCVCSAPNGKVDIMTRNEIKEYPECIIGTVYEIPDYDEWGPDDENRIGKHKIKINNRIWIDIK